MHLKQTLEKEVCQVLRLSNFGSEGLTSTMHHKGKKMPQAAGTQLNYVLARPIIHLTLKPNQKTHGNENNLLALAVVVDATEFNDSERKSATRLATA